MQNFGKWAVITPVAAVMTCGLFLGMRGLISGEWQAQEKSKETKFEINPVIIDIAPPLRSRMDQTIETVETPPPPPQIDRETAKLPSEPIATEPGAFPDFKVPKIDRTVFSIAMIDADVQPLVRIAPITPQRFLAGDNSGHCNVQFDVSAEGSPYNVETTFCTSSVLENTTIKSVQKWLFKPKIADGRPVAMRGVRNKVTYRLLDERGTVLPEPGY